MATLSSTEIFSSDRTASNRCKAETAAVAGVDPLTTPSCCFLRSVVVVVVGEEDEEEDRHIRNWQQQYR